VFVVNDFACVKVYIFDPQKCIADTSQNTHVKTTRAVRKLPFGVIFMRWKRLGKFNEHFFDGGDVL